MAIQRVLKKTAETKYVAYEIADGYVMGNLIGDLPNRRLQNIIPPLSQSATTTNAHTRMGNSIQPVKLLVTIQYFFQGDGLAGGQDVNAVNKAGLYEVRQFSVAPKSIRSGTQWTNAIAQSLQAKLLEVGDGTTVAPYSATTQNILYPVSNENFTNLRGNKKFIMGKNTGAMIGGSDYPLATARAQNTIRYALKLPKTLVYDENSATVPSNFLALWGAYATNITNYNATASTTYDGLQNPLLSNSSPTHPIIRYTLRAELWFKDI